MAQSTMKRLFTGTAFAVLVAGTLLAPLTGPVSRAHAGGPPPLLLGCSSNPQVCLGTITASAISVPLNTSVTIQATTDVNVTPTPLYIVITDETNHVVARCGNGTVCPVAVSSSIPAVHTYTASLQTASGQIAANGIGSVTVVFRPGPCANDGTSTVCLTGLTVSNPHPFYNQGVTLTASTSIDVGPTAFYIQIVDETGAEVAECPSGSSCAVTLFNQPAHIYTAYLSTDRFVNTANASAPSIYLTWAPQ